MLLQLVLLKQLPLGLIEHLSVLSLLSRLRVELQVLLFLLLCLFLRLLICRLVHLLSLGLCLIERLIGVAHGVN